MSLEYDNDKIMTNEMENLRNRFHWNTKNIERTYKKGLKDSFKSDADMKFENALKRVKESVKGVKENMGKVFKSLNESVKSLNESVKSVGTNIKNNMIKTTKKVPNIVNKYFRKNVEKGLSTSTVNQLLGNYSEDLMKGIKSAEVEDVNKFLKDCMTKKYKTEAPYVNAPFIHNANKDGLLDCAISEIVVKSNDGNDEKTTELINKVLPLKEGNTHNVNSIIDRVVSSYKEENSYEKTLEEKLADAFSLIGSKYFLKGSESYIGNIGKEDFEKQAEFLYGVLEPIYKNSGNEKLNVKYIGKGSDIELKFNNSINQSAIFGMTSEEISKFVTDAKMTADALSSENSSEDNKYTRVGSYETVRGKALEICKSVKDFKTSKEAAVKDVFELANKNVLNSIEQGKGAVETQLNEISGLIKEHTTKDFNYYDFEAGVNAIEEVHYKKDENIPEFFKVMAKEAKNNCDYLYAYNNGDMRYSVNRRDSAVANNFGFPTETMFADLTNEDTLTKYAIDNAYELLNTKNPVTEKVIKDYLTDQFYETSKQIENSKELQSELGKVFFAKFASDVIKVRNGANAEEIEYSGEDKQEYVKKLEAFSKKDANGKFIIDCFPTTTINGNVFENAFDYKTLIPNKGPYSVEQKQLKKAFEKLCGYVAYSYVDNAATETLEGKQIIEASKSKIKTGINEKLNLIKQNVERNIDVMNISEKQLENVTGFAKNMLNNMQSNLFYLAKVNGEIATAVSENEILKADNFGISNSVITDKLSENKIEDKINELVINGTLIPEKAEREFNKFVSNVIENVSNQISNNEEFVKEQSRIYFAKFAADVLSVREGMDPKYAEFDDKLADEKYVKLLETFCETNKKGEYKVKCFDEKGFNYEAAKEVEMFKTYAKSFEDIRKIAARNYVLNVLNGNEIIENANKQFADKMNHKVKFADNINLRYKADEELTKQAHKEHIKKYESGLTEEMFSDIILGKEAVKYQIKNGEKYWFNPSEREEYFDKILSNVEEAVKNNVTNNFIMQVIEKDNNEELLNAGITKFNETMNDNLSELESENIISEENREYANNYAKALKDENATGEFNFEASENSKYAKINEAMKNAKAEATSAKFQVYADNTKVQNALAQEENRLNRIIKAQIKDAKKAIEKIKKASDKKRVANAVERNNVRNEIVAKLIPFYATESNKRTDALHNAAYNYEQILNDVPAFIKNIIEDKKDENFIKKVNRNSFLGLKKSAEMIKFIEENGELVENLTDKALKIINIEKQNYESKNEKREAAKKGLVAEIKFETHRYIMNQEVKRVLQNKQEKTFEELSRVYEEEKQTLSKLEESLSAVAFIAHIKDISKPNENGEYDKEAESLGLKYLTEEQKNELFEVTVDDVIHKTASGIIENFRNNYNKYVEDLSKNKNIERLSEEAVDKFKEAMNNEIVSAWGKTDAEKCKDLKNEQLLNNLQNIGIKQPEKFIDEATEIANESGIEEAFVKVYNKNIAKRIFTSKNKQESEVAYLRNFANNAISSLEVTKRQYSIENDEDLKLMLTYSIENHYEDIAKGKRAKNANDAKAALIELKNAKLDTLSKIVTASNVISKEERENGNEPEIFDLCYTMEGKEKSDSIRKEFKGLVEEIAAEINQINNEIEDDELTQELGEFQLFDLSEAKDEAELKTGTPKTRKWPTKQDVKNWLSKSKENYDKAKDVFKKVVGRIAGSKAMNEIREENRRLEAENLFDKTYPNYNPNNVNRFASSVNEEENVKDYKDAFRVNDGRVQTQNNSDNKTTENSSEEISEDKVTENFEELDSVTVNNESVQNPETETPAGEQPNAKDSNGEVESVENEQQVEQDAVVDPATETIETQSAVEPTAEQLFTEQLRDDIETYVSLVQTLHAINLQVDNCTENGEEAVNGLNETYIAISSTLKNNKFNNFPIIDGNKFIEASFEDKLAQSNELKKYLSKEIDVIVKRQVDLKNNELANDVVQPKDRFAQANAFFNFAAARQEEMARSSQDSEESIEGNIESFNNINEGIRKTALASVYGEELDYDSIINKVLDQKPAGKYSMACLMHVLSKLPKSYDSVIAPAAMSEQRNINANSANKQSESDEVRVNKEQQTEETQGFELPKTVEELHAKLKDASDLINKYTENNAITGELKNLINNVNMVYSGLETDAASTNEKFKNNLDKMIESFEKNEEDKYYLTKTIAQILENDYNHKNAESEEVTNDTIQEEIDKLNKLADAAYRIEKENQNENLKTEVAEHVPTTEEIEKQKQEKTKNTSKHSK